MKTEFEKFVSENRNAFDVEEPSPVVWKRISDELDGLSRIHHRKVYSLFAMAAAVLILISLSYMAAIFLLRISGQNLAGNNPDPRMMHDFYEAEKFYSMQLSSILAQIKTCTQSDPAVYSELVTDLDELTRVTHELKQDLADQAANREVIEAMIRTYQLKLQLLENVLDELNDLNACNSQSNEKADL